MQRSTWQAGQAVRAAPRRILWLIGGAFAMGQGIWAMHYIGMLAFRLPVAVSYNVPIVLLSLLAAMGSSAVALLVVSRKELSRAYLTAGSFVMGGGIAAMHYIGMQAMRLAAQPVYNLRLVALSVITAILVSDVALRLAFRLRDQNKNRPWSRPASAVVMGFAIASMHYIGMAAVCFQHSAPPTGVSNSISVSSLGITGIAAVTFMVLALSLLGSQADRRFSLQRDMLHSEQERWRVLMEANHDGLFDYDLLTGEVFVSPRWEAILGFAPGEFKASRAAWLERIHAEDAQRVEIGTESTFSLGMELSRWNIEFGTGTEAIAGFSRAARPCGIRTVAPCAWWDRIRISAPASGTKKTCARLRSDIARSSNRIHYPA